MVLYPIFNTNSSSTSSPNKPYESHTSTNQPGILFYPLNSKFIPPRSAKMGMKLVGDWEDNYTGVGPKKTILKLSRAMLMMALTENINCGLHR